MDNIDDSPPPEGYLTIQLPASSRDTNIFGDVNGGWLSAQMVLAAETRAAQIAKGRIATVSIGTMEFVSPVLVGTLLSFLYRSNRNRQQLYSNKSRCLGAMLRWS